MGSWLSQEEDRSEQYKQKKQSQPPRRQGQQHRDSSVPGSTGALLCDLDEKFQCYLGQIRSLKAEKSNKSAAYQLYKINCDVQKRLVGLNWRMYDVHKFATPPPGPEPNIQRLEDENNELRVKINLLESEKQHLDGLLTSTMRQSAINLRKDDPSRQHFTQTQYSHSQKKEEMNRTIQEQAEQLKQLEANIQGKDYEVSSLNTVIESLKSYLATQENRIKNLQKEIMELSEDNQNLKLRLSKVAGQKLMENNPAIADLSDPNRPTKLGEMYSEIYDNEWTDAYEQLLEAGYTEEECIDTLRLTLLNTLQFCQKKSTKLLEKTQEAVDCLFEEYKEAVENKEVPKHLTVPRKLVGHWGNVMRQASFEDNQSRFDEDKSLIVLLPKWKAKAMNRQQSVAGSGRKMAPSYLETSLKQGKDVVKKQLKAFRKEVAESMVPLVQKAYVSASWDDDCLPAMQPYIKKCLLLGWMMVVQSPPLVLDMCMAGSWFDKDRYKEYTRSGPKVQFVVWPAILLHDGGPVIGKGVAQGQP